MSIKTALVNALEQAVFGVEIMKLTINMGPGGL